MRLANVGGRLALQTGGGYMDVAAASEGRFGPDPQAAFGDWAAFRSWADAAAEAGTDGATTGLDTSDLGAPVPAPRQVFAIGMNYRDHATEAGHDVPEVPPVFTKFPTCLVGPNEPVVVAGDTVDWEVELVVVIGQRCDHVVEGDTWGHIAGVMVGQDLSERTLQLSGPAPQFSLGKSFPGFGPIGPVLVTPDELSDPDDLELGCRLESGEVLQKGRTGDMIFSVSELVARLSAVCPLLPGDLIFTGTPAGIGGARTPPVFLHAGDVLVSWIDGIGSLRNPMIALPVSTAGSEAR